MTVLINEVEVVVEPPSAPAGEAPPQMGAQTQAESGEAASGTPLSGADMRSVIRHLSDRAERLRAH